MLLRLRMAMNPMPVTPTKSSGMALGSGIDTVPLQTLPTGLSYPQLARAVTLKPKPSSISANIMGWHEEQCGRLEKILGTQNFRL